MQQVPHNKKPPIFLSNATVLKNRIEMLYLTKKSKKKPWISEKWTKSHGAKQLHKFK